MLNALTLMDSYPLPRMEKCIDSLGEIRIFPTLDASFGYLKIEMDEPCRIITEFASQHRRFQIVQMPLYLKNRPATFQQGKEVILLSVKWQSVLVYLDDIVVFSKNDNKHMAHYPQVLTMLRIARVTLKLRKCRFFAERMNYLGQTIRPGRLELSEATTAAVRERKDATTQTELGSVLGLSHVFRQFVSSFSEAAAPLNKKLRKYQR